MHQPHFSKVKFSETIQSYPWNWVNNYFTFENYLLTSYLLSKYHKVENCVGAHSHQCTMYNSSLKCYQSWYGYLNCLSWPFIYLDCKKIADILEPVCPTTRLGRRAPTSRTIWAFRSLGIRINAPLDAIKCRVQHMEAAALL